MMWVLTASADVVNVAVPPCKAADPSSVVPSEKFTNSPSGIAP